MTETLNNPTLSMIKAGELFLKNASELEFNVRMFGVNETKTLESWSKSYSNQDIILEHYQNKISVTAAIYKVMERARVSI